MKLKEEFIKAPKPMIYEMYSRIVYDIYDYDDVTRSKMLDEIIKEYSQKNFLYHMCTTKELEFLKYAVKKQISMDDVNKYSWEINTLNDKGIFSKVTFTVFDEQKINVDEALKTYKDNGKNGYEDIIIFMISKIRTNADMLTKALTTMIKSVCNIDEAGVNKLMGSPLFHFYCDFYYNYLEFSKNEEEFVFYRDYYDILDDLEIARKKYGIGGALPVDIRDDFDIFYYGFPIRKEKVEKMYKEINKRFDKNFLIKVIDEARVLNERTGLKFLIDNNMFQIVNDALDETPCAAMNGFTPKDYERQTFESIDLDKEFKYVPQNNAHLCKNAADHYYKLYFALLEYVNKKYNMHPEIKRIYKQEGLDVNKLQNIDQKLWENKEIIEEFIKDNNYDFNEEELKEIKEFENAVSSDYFVIVGFEREYTKILSDDGKLYMVKGIRADIDKIINPRDIPIIISTTLLMFKENIVFKSFFSNINLELSNDIKKDIVDKMKKAMKYYHL